MVKEYRIGDPLPLSREFILKRDFTSKEQMILNHAVDLLSLKDFSVSSSRAAAGYGSHMGLDNEIIEKTKTKLSSGWGLTTFDRKQQWTLYAAVIELITTKATRPLDHSIRSLSQQELQSLSDKLMYFRGFRNENIKRE